MKKSVLIVDDDITMLKLAGMTLSQNGFEVHQAKTGVDALSFLKRNGVDLIILDLEMPMMHGMKVLEKIRNDRNLAHIPVVLLTSTADTDTVIEACRLEAADYIKKPFKPEQLIERVWRAL